MFLKIIIISSNNKIIPKDFSEATINFIAHSLPEYDLKAITLKKIPLPNKANPINKVGKYQNITDWSAWLRDANTLWI